MLCPAGGFVGGPVAMGLSVDVSGAGVRTGDIAVPFSLPKLPS